MAAIEQRFKSPPIPLNPFTSGNNPFFPDKCMSYGGAHWAFSSVRTFADDYFRRLSVPPVYESYADELRLP
jgi:hypothetical protein